MTPIADVYPLENEAQKCLVQLNLLGPLTATVDDAPTDIPGRRLRAVLAVLAVAAGQPVSVDQLADRVWGAGQQPANVRRTLQTYVMRLRQLLGQPAIVTTPSGYQLQTQRVEVDAVRFVELTQGSMSLPLSDRRRRFDEALSLWRGEPLAEQLSEWLNVEATTQLTERYLRAVEEVADLDLAIGRPDDHLETLREQAALHPYRESLWAKLIIVLDRVGRHADALTSYQQLRARLAEELGIDPAPELQDLFARLLQAEPAVPAAPIVLPRQLPADCRDFAGRERQLAELDRLVDQRIGEEMILVSLHGAGGVGKTTLAVHWGHLHQDHFPGGILFLDLYGFGPSRPVTPHEALTTVLSGLGLRADEIPADLEGATARFRSLVADRRLLLILDNARDEQQVRPLLPGSGAVVLVTSRNRLRGLNVRNGGVGVLVDGLRVEESTALLQRTGVPTRDSSTADLVQLATLCDGYPLAIRLAGQACRQTGSVAAVVTAWQQRQHRLDALAGDDPLADLRAIFRWSTAAVDEPTRRMFQLLAAHPAVGFRVEAAASMAAVDLRAARRQLERLVDTGLLSSQDADHYRMHDLIREYSAELAADDAMEQEFAQRRLVSWVVHSCGRAMEIAGTTPENVSAHLPLSDDLAVLEFADAEQAAQWFRTDGPGMIRIAESAAESRLPGGAWIVIRLFSYLLQQHPPNEALRLQSLALLAARATGDQLAEAHLLNQLGTSHARLREYQVAEELFLAAFQQFGVIGGERRAKRQGMAMNNLGNLYGFVGRPDDAIRCAKQALILEGQDAPATAGNIANDVMIDAYLAAGRWREALIECDRQLGILDRPDAGPQLLNMVARIWRCRGRAALRQDDHEAARQSLDRAVDLFQQAGAAEWDLAVTARWIGAVEHAAGDRSAAETRWREALAVIDGGGVLDESELSRSDLVALLGDLAKDRQLVR